jgi:hypothetical protein
MGYHLRRGADKFLAFFFQYFLVSCLQHDPKIFFSLDGLKKL